MQRRYRVLFSPGSHCLSTSHLFPRANHLQDAITHDSVPAHDKSSSHDEEVGCSSTVVASPTSSLTRIWIASTPIVLSPSRPRVHDNSWQRSSTVCFHDVRSYVNRVPRVPTYTGAASGKAKTRADVSATSKFAIQRPSGRFGASQQALIDRVTDGLAQASMPTKSNEDLRKDVEQKQTRIDELTHGLADAKKAKLDLQAEIKKMHDQFEQQLRDKIFEEKEEIRKAGEQEVADKLSDFERRATTAEARATEALASAARSRKVSDEARHRHENGLSETAEETTRLREQQERHEAEHKTKLKALEIERIKQQNRDMDRAAAEEKGLRQRQDERKTYIQYRELFDDADRLTGDFVRACEAFTQFGEQYWARATRDFDRFRDEQAASWSESNYSGIFDQIDRYIKDNSSRITLTGNYAHLSELVNLLRRSKLESHGSRMITRTLRYENVKGTNTPKLIVIIRDTLTKLTTHPVHLALERLRRSTEHIESWEKHMTILKSTLERLEERVKRRIFQRFSSLPDAYKVMSKDFDDISQIGAPTEVQFRKSIYGLSKHLNIPNRPTQVGGVFKLRDDMRALEHKIYDNTIVSRLAQANSKTLPKELVEEANHFLSTWTRTETRGHSTRRDRNKQTAAERASQLENRVFEEDESIEAKINEDVSILQLAKKLATQPLVMEDANLATRMSRFISKFDPSGQPQSEAVQRVRKLLTKKLNKALETQDPTKFGPIRTTLGIALRKVTRTFAEPERPAEGMKTEAERAAPARARRVRPRQVTSPKPRSILSQRRAFSHVSRVEPSA